MADRTDPGADIATDGSVISTVRERRWQKLMAHLRDAPGHLPPATRKAVFLNDGMPPDLAEFVATVVRFPSRITDGHVATLVHAGHSEDEIFEVIVVAAAGAADRRLQAARHAMSRA